MLHVISPTHFTTSTSLFGLMRIAIHQLHQENHRVVVIGDVSEAKQCRNQGVPVLGSLSGSLDASKTLSKRLMSFVSETQKNRAEKIMAWGWNAMCATEKCSMEYDSCAVIDEIDQWAPCSGGHLVIPTTEVASKIAKETGVVASQLAEPIIGVEPTSVFANDAIVKDALQLRGDEFLVSIIGDVGSWQDILEMIIRLNSLQKTAHFVLPPRYRDRVMLMNAANNHGIRDSVHCVPPSIRQVDVLRLADCAWSPSLAPFDCSTNALDVLFAAWMTTPLAVNKEHPVSSIPTIGSQIAWAADDVEVCGWMMDLMSKKTTPYCDYTEQVDTVRSIAAPSRFIESLQMRMHALV
tara:strand:- start:836 stop:1888 length:1053 start_codon:yes stop_codon:yes gene_type:complete